MTLNQEKQLKLEIAHIFDSGANEIRIFNMVKQFMEAAPNESLVEREGIYVTRFLAKKLNKGIGNLFEFREGQFIEDKDIHYQLAQMSFEDYPIFIWKDLYKTGFRQGEVLWYEYDPFTKERNLIDEERAKRFIKHFKLKENKTEWNSKYSLFYTPKDTTLIVK